MLIHRRYRRSGGLESSASNRFSRRRNDFCSTELGNFCQSGADRNLFAQPGSRSVRSAMRTAR